jgi:hypothetical protein
MTGFEPATSGATVRRSTAELHPPQGAWSVRLKAEAPEARSQTAPEADQCSTRLNRRATQGRRSMTPLRATLTKSPRISTSALFCTPTAVGWTWSALRLLASYMS